MSTHDGLNFDSRAAIFLEEARNFASKHCAHLPQAQRMELLLTGIYLTEQKLLEALQQGGNYFRIEPFSVVALDEAVQVLDIETNGRVREVSIWMDSAVGMPDPTIRVSTGASGTGGNGIRVSPGGPTELGKVPPNTRLYISSDVSINGYVIERG